MPPEQPAQALAAAFNMAGLPAGTVDLSDGNSVSIEVTYSGRLGTLFLRPEYENDSVLWMLLDAHAGVTDEGTWSVPTRRRRPNARRHHDTIAHTRKWLAQHEAAVTPPAPDLTASNSEPTQRDRLTTALGRALRQHGITFEPWSSFDPALEWLLIRTADGGEITVSDASTQLHGDLAHFQGLRVLYQPTRTDEGVDHEVTLWASPQLGRTNGGAARFTAELLPLVAAINAGIQLALSRTKWTRSRHDDLRLSLPHPGAVHARFHRSSKGMGLCITSTSRMDAEEIAAKLYQAYRLHFLTSDAPILTRAQVLDTVAAQAELCAQGRHETTGAPDPEMDQLVRDWAASKIARLFPEFGSPEDT